MDFQTAITNAARAIQVNDINEDQLDRADVEQWFDVCARYLNDTLTQAEYRAELPELCATFNAVLDGTVTIVLPP